MAIEAPPHLEIGVLRHERHFVDATVTSLTADALLHMDAVIEVDEIGKVMHFDPGDGLIGAIAGANRFESRAVDPDLRVAVHAGFRRRDRRESGSLNRAVTITTVNAHRADVVRVAEGDRLRPRDVLIGGVGRIRAEFECHCAQTRDNDKRNDDADL